MKIKTWIKYKEAYIPPRCCKPRYKEYSEHIDVSLQEAAMSDLLLAFEDKSPMGKGKIYTYKGKLWRQTIIRDICAGGEDEYGYHTPLEALMYWNDHRSQYFYLEQGTNRADILNRVRQGMRKYLLVNGDLFIRTEEPRYCIYTFGLGHNHGGTALFVDYKYNPNISKDCYFSALQGKEAVAEANRVAQARGDSKDVGRFDADIVVHMPELVKVRP